ncbi:MAG: carbohydrate kinase [Bacteroidetes bacterium]|nr:carbohydrate kinase [Bacteroidota bacterium]
MYLLGYDIGSSSIKAALVQADTGAVTAVVQYPETEMSMVAVQPGWAEQAPELWWECVCAATRKLLQKTNADTAEIKGIGISYQMHGLVVVDKNHTPVRPSIIWCDSRAVEIGNRAFDEIGHDKCLSHLLNSPGNFTATKLAWVKENEPVLFEKIDKFMLPGDYIAMRLTGEAMTTPSGLSEGIFWDFLKNEVSETVLDYFDFDKKLIPTIAPTFSLQGELSAEAAEATGLRKGIPVAYRAGDQPNNALSLNVLNPGEVAATGGTSGVVYGVVDKPVYDPQSRVNGFVHVTHQKEKPRIGILLCINGAGIQYSWARQNMSDSGKPYPELERLAATVPVGSDGLRILPFGNGAERMLENKSPGAHVSNLQFNRHNNAHFYRAALEGIAFSFVHGVKILQDMGVNAAMMRVGNDNLFQSAIFSNTISNLLGNTIEMVETTGAVGAAKASGVATGVYASVEEAMSYTNILKTYEPQNVNGIYKEAFEAWQEDLAKII